MTILINLKCELTIFTLDFSQASVFELDKSIFKDIENKSNINDFSLYAMELFLKKKIRIIKLCQYPILSEEKEDYCVISACTQIISSYYKHKEILMNNEEFMQIMKKYGINFE